LSDGKYKYESELDPKFENELLEIDSQITEELAPINKKLNFIS